MKRSDEYGQATISERLAAAFCHLDPDAATPRAKEIAVNDLVDVAGLCIAARNTDYVAALLRSLEAGGACTALGHARALDAGGAAIVNGAAAHGEDFDDTLEGSPVHPGAVVIPAVLATCERFSRGGRDVLAGVLAGLETACRLNLVAPGGMHKACFHPTAIIGAFGATVGAGVALGLDEDQLTDALGASGSMCGGIIEYLTDGAWTKRLHAGWAAQVGVRAALMGRERFFGPRTVFEGEHNAFRAFAPSVPHRYEGVTEDLGERWLMERIAFKPHAAGTMMHPYLDCMIRLAASGEVQADQIERIECETAEGIVHRLWEPLADKRRPPHGYAAKFSMPFGVAAAFLEGAGGLAQFSDEKTRDPAILALAARVGYVIDPDNPYPDSYTGHVRVTLRDGRVHELRQPHFRGGVHEPLSRDELIEKFRANVAYGGLDAARGEALLALFLGIEDAPDLSGLAEFRG